MEIAIKYMPNDSDPLGLTEKQTSPLEPGEENLRAGIRCYNGTWCVCRERFATKNGKTGWYPDGRKLLVYDGGNLDDYYEYLNNTVAYIAIDGSVVWANKMLETED